MSLDYQLWLQSRKPLPPAGLEATLRKLFALFACLGVCATAFCQQPAEAPTSTFTANTELVMVPTVVVDQSGKHVPNLTKQDFSVLQDNREQRIAFFEEINPDPEKRVQHQDNVYSNYLGGNATSARLTIYALDMINTPFMGQAEVRKILLQTLEKSGDDGEPKAVVVFTRKGLKVLHEFTTDPEILVRAVRRFRAKGAEVDHASLAVPDAAYDRVSEFAQVSQTEYNEFQQREAVELTDDCLRQIATAFSGVPGRKALLWATGGFPMMILSQLQGQVRSSMETLPRYERTWRMLNSANVAVYPIDVREVTFPGFVDATVSNMSQRQQAFRAAWQEQGTTTMVNYAMETGGKACTGRMDFTGCFEEALQESRSYYMIGYYLEKKVKPGWHKLQVKTRLKDTKIRARTGVEVPDPERKVEVKNEYEKALLSPLIYTGIPLSVKWTGTNGFKNGKRSVQFELAMPAGAFQIDEANGNHMKLELTAIGTNEKGASAGLRGKMLEAKFKPESADRIRRDGFVYRDAVEVGSGEQSVRFVVRDHLSGRIGSVTAQLKAE